ncbi:phenylacetate--CoA ligase family protein [Streptomyces sp. SID8358]|uniref:phenylacetate--CoA ligase family protein n=1 Tax=Streptomyces sp. SID8358 TaxID=2690342 RepID=UPI000DAE7143|nr:phenylacetate--CoA ligase family protein [Streptomyces sp. SID8358]MYU36540.1 phenylacetate--CoA ligase family protein [Streptomyces sp. SID8358]
MTRHHPTDLLLAVDHVQRDLATDAASPVARVLKEADLLELGALLDADALAQALDEALGGLSQFPWRPLTDTGDVWEQTPVGRVVLDDTRAGNTLRGLLLSWAMGNTVLVRTSRPALWRSVFEVLREPGFPLPAAEVAAPGTDAEGTVVTVPDLVVLSSDAVTPSDELYAGAVRPGVPSVRIRPTPGRPGPQAPVADLDCRSPWFRELFTSVYLAGTSLDAARRADPDRASRMDARLRYLVGMARRTAHYRDLPRVDGVADLARLPVLEKAVLEAESLPRGRAMSSGAVPSGEVLRSGASGGEPRYIVYARTDWENMVREAIPLLRALGVHNGDRVLNALVGGGLYGGLMTTASELSRMRVEAFSAGQQVTADLMLMLVRDFSVNVLLGQPAVVLPLLREARRRDPGLRLDKVVYGGTPMTESDKQWLRDELGTRSITSILAANDGAQIGYQCDRLGGTLHHVNDDYNLVEVVDEDGAPLPDGETGHLLITAMQKFEGPLIRYRIGDMGRVTERDCPCGVSGRVLEYLGRSDGQLKFKSMTVYYGEMLAALEEFRVSQLQAELSTREGTETLVLRTESREKLDPAVLHAALTEAFPALSGEHFYDDGLRLFELVVECHPEGALDRNPVSGKIRTVIDRRLD